jgi:hypothetical protein
MLILLSITGWGFAGDQPSEGLGSGSDWVGVLFATILAVILGVLGLAISMLVRVIVPESG